MIRPVQIRRQARTEIDDASEWYQARSEGLGPEFLRAFESVVSRVQRHPEAYPIARGDIRRATMRRFPYIVFYRLHDNAIVILACVHERRDPARWQSRV